MPAGRPTKYSKEIADAICYDIAHGMTLRKIEIKHNVDLTTIYDWILKNEEFSEQYTQARVLQADFFADQSIDIADDNSEDIKTIIDKNGNVKQVVDHEVVNRSRLMVDTRKWHAEIQAPKKYGVKKLDITSGGEKLPNAISITFTEPEKPIE